MYKYVKTKLHQIFWLMLFILAVLKYIARRYTLGIAPFKFSLDIQ